MDLNVQHQFYCSPWNLTLRTIKLFLFLQWGSCPRGLGSSRPDSAEGKGAEEDGETTANLLVGLRRLEEAARRRPCAGGEGSSLQRAPAGAAGSNSPTWARWRWEEPRLRQCRGGGGLTAAEQRSPVREAMAKRRRVAFARDRALGRVFIGWNAS